MKFLRSEADTVGASQQEHRIVGPVVRSRRQLYRTHALYGTTDLRNRRDVDRPMIRKFGTGSEHTSSPLYQTIST
jgi:hypothetical protein